jgi:DNA-binding transcriptional ArsR family regulator
MDTKSALAALASLAQDTRLDTFRLLVKHEPQGLRAGDIGAALGVPQNTLSSHLAILTRAGLTRAERQGRSIIYRADLDGLRSLTLFLLQDCCGASASLCQPLLDAITPCCPSAPLRKSPSKAKS